MITNVLNEIRTNLVDNWNQMLLSNSAETMVLNTIRQNFTVKENTGYIFVDLGIPGYDNVFIDIVDLSNIVDALENDVELINAIKIVADND